MFKYLNDAKAIGKLVTSAVDQSKILNRDIHNALMQTLAHACDESRGGPGHGDVTLLHRLVTGLQESGFPMEGIRRWVTEQSPVYFPVIKGGGFETKLRKPMDDKFIKPDWETLDAKPFWEYAPSRINEAFDPSALLETAKKAANRYTKLLNNTAFDDDGIGHPVDEDKRFLATRNPAVEAYLAALVAVVVPKVTPTLAANNEAVVPAEAKDAA